jgi:2-polyprenyl-3-methyl-5-hydroxy-6-metoxy-1,4-benzoquinol methylase
MDACPICDKTETKRYLSTKDFFLTQEKFDIVQCTNCNFLFTDPIPKIEHLYRYYDSPEYTSHGLKKPSLTGRIYQIIRKINIKNKYNLINKHQNDGHILDVGCGTGELLKYFKNKGWSATGIEPADVARDYAIEKHGLDVYAEAKLLEFNNDTFDVISMWHVLEHVYHLNDRLEQLKRVLKTNGYLVIAVPNIESYDAAYYGQYWAGLDVPRHLYHFSKQTLSRLISNHKFEIISMYPMIFDAYYVSLLSEKFKSKGIGVYTRAFLRGIKSNRLASRTENYSSMIFVVKKK